MRVAAALGVFVACAAPQQVRPLIVDDVPVPKMPAEQLDSVRRDSVVKPDGTVFKLLETPGQEEQFSFFCGGFVYGKRPGLVVALKDLPPGATLVSAEQDPQPTAVAAIIRAGDAAPELKCGDRVALPPNGEASLFMSRRPVETTPTLPNAEGWVAIATPTQALVKAPGVRSDNPGMLGWISADRFFPVLRLRGLPPAEHERDDQLLFLQGVWPLYATRTIPPAQLRPVSSWVAAEDGIDEDEPLIAVAPSAFGRHRVVTADGQSFDFADADLTTAPKSRLKHWPTHARGCLPLATLMALYADATVKPLIEAYQRAQVGCVEPRVHHTDEFMGEPMRRQHMQSTTCPAPRDDYFPCSAGYEPARQALVAALESRRAAVLDAQLHKIIARWQ